MPKPFVWIFALLFLAPSSTMWAQPLPARAPVRGQVVDEAGRPLAGATLSIRRHSEAGSFGFWGADSLSDTRGAFTFPDAEEGTYALSAELSGYAPKNQIGIVWTLQSAALDVPMQRLVSVRARILSPEGTPLKNSVVQIRFRIAEGEGSQRGGRRTDANGVVALGVIAPGNYAIWARAEAGIAVLKSQNISSTNAEDLEIRLNGAATLRARVEDASGRALGGATLVSLAPDSPPTRALWNDASGTEIVTFLAAQRRVRVTSRDGDGNLEIPVPPGRYLASFAARQGLLDTPRVVVVGEENPLQIWTLARAADATLTLDVRERDQALALGEVVFRLARINANGTLGGGPESFSTLGPPVRFAELDSSGRAALFPVAPARYRIWASRRTELGEGAAKESASVDVDASASGGIATLVLP